MKPHVERETGDQKQILRTVPFFISTDNCAHLLFFYARSMQNCHKVSNERMSYQHILLFQSEIPTLMHQLPPPGAKITSPVLPEVLIRQEAKAIPWKRTFQISLTGSNQDGTGCTSMHLEMAVLKKLKGYETPSTKEKQKSALGQFKTLTRQEFDAVEKATQCYLALQSSQLNLFTTYHFPSSSKTKHLP